MAKHGVRGRRGWPAINFFFNTGVDAHQHLTLDEPWSRPGDYVLLRAMTDLVCASSSCPDDIDPANGWQPTDIHIRVYSDKERFSIAMANRKTPDADPVLTRESGFHPGTSALTRQFVDYRGFWTPIQFDGHGALSEYHGCREKVAVMDLSALRKFEVLGPDAEALLDHSLALALPLLRGPAAAPGGGTPTVVITGDGADVEQVVREVRAALGKKPGAPGLGPA
ncbi:urea carboxylase-associated protein 1 [compost metagenome]